MLGLTPPRHISTLRIPAIAAASDDKIYFRDGS